MNNTCIKSVAFADSIVANLYEQDLFISTLDMVNRDKAINDIINYSKRLSSSIAAIIEDSDWHRQIFRDAPHKVSLLWYRITKDPPLFCVYEGVFSQLSAPNLALVISDHAGPKLLIYAINLDYLVINLTKYTFFVFKDWESAANSCLKNMNDYKYYLTSFEIK